MPERKRRVSAKPRPVYALMKGLACLSVVSRHDRLSLVDAVREMKLPKSTTYRLLETLCLAGYLVQDDDLRYRTTRLAAMLGPRYEDKAWIREAAHPKLIELGNEVVWAVGIATPLGISMYVQSSTSDQSPLAIERFRAGAALRMDTTAGGHLYLAYQSKRLRALYIAALKHQSAEFESLVYDAPSFDAWLDRIRVQGYIIAQATGVESVVCVPLAYRRRMIACIGMRFIQTALSTSEIVENFVPRLTDAAKRIAAELARKNYMISSNKIDGNYEIDSAEPRA